MKKISTLFIGLSVLALFGAGCITIGSNKNVSESGGFLKSVNKGVLWEKKNISPTAKGIGTIANINIEDLTFDPQDEKAIYLSSAGNGLFYTWDGAESWNYVQSLGTGYVNSIAIDYKNKCILYVALQNRILKTIDCTRSWDGKYFDTRTNEFISYLAINPENSNIIYAGLSGGDLLKSADAGESWTTTERFNDKIVKILINPENPRNLMIVLSKNGLRVSNDSGITWTDLNKQMADFRGSSLTYDLVTDKGSKTIFQASSYGILKSEDFGKNWTDIELLTPPGTVQIYSMVVNPNNNKEIYYSTASTFYSSFDGGKNWITKKLPTPNAGSALLVNPKDSNMLYMGTKSLAK